MTFGCKEALSKTKMCKTVLQKLVGVFRIASRAIRGARTFSCLSIEVLCTLRDPYHKTEITAALQEEMQWWWITPLLCCTEFASRSLG